MRAVIQRVRRARVTVHSGDGIRVAAGSAALREPTNLPAARTDPVTTGSIAAGVVVLLGVSKEDTPADAAYLAEKTANLRVFDDGQGKMNVSLLESGHAALVVSQFTLYGDVRRGRRPGFDRAASPAEAEPLYEEFVRSLRAAGVRVETGIFQAHMEVELVNDGPVTILVDSEKTF
jgi:D-tyrosyl-tRNA(Tyr) deacylase